MCSLEHSQANVVAFHCFCFSLFLLLLRHSTPCRCRSIEKERDIQGYHHNLPNNRSSCWGEQRNYTLLDQRIFDAHNASKNIKRSHGITLALTNVMIFSSALIFWVLYDPCSVKMRELLGNPSTMIKRLTETWSRARHEGNLEDRGGGFPIDRVLAFLPHHFALFCTVPQFCKNLRP